MNGYKYCVANVRVNCIGESKVSYYAFRAGQYGLHLVEDFKDDYVLWYDTAEEARAHILNIERECVLSFHTDYIPKFNNK